MERPANSDAIAFTRFKAPPIDPAKMHRARQGRTIRVSRNGEVIEDLVWERTTTARKKGALALRVLFLLTACITDLYTDSRKPMVTMIVEWQYLP